MKSFESQWTNHQAHQYGGRRPCNARSTRQFICFASSLDPSKSHPKTTHIRTTKHASHRRDRDIGRIFIHRIRPIDLDRRGDLTWSSPANWSGGVPGSNTDVIFTDAGLAGTSDTVTSIVDQPLTISSLTFDNTSGYQYLYLQNSSENLDVNGTLSVDSGGTVSFGGEGANLTANSVEVDSGDLTVNAGATLSVTGYLLMGYSGTAAINLLPASADQPAAGLQLGTAANPIAAYVGFANGTTTFAPNSTTNPNVSMNLSVLSIGTDSSNATVDLTNYTGPLSIGSLYIGNYPGELGPGTGHFIFGNSTLNSLSIPTVEVDSGDLTVNAGATLSVTGYLLMGYSGTAAINLLPASADQPAAGLQLGTAANPIAAYVGFANGTTTFAPNSTTNPNVSMNLSVLSIGTDSSNATVDLTNYTGPLSIGSLYIGNYPGELGPGTGHFIFGNSTLNSLSIPTVEVDSGDLTVNAGATLSVTGYLLMGYSGTAAINLLPASADQPAAGLQLGTAANPIAAYVGFANGTTTFAPNSTTNPNVSMNLSVLSIGTDSSNATVDLTNYTGPLSIGSLYIGNYPGELGPGTGHFIFGNSTLNSLSIPTVEVDSGDLTINAGATLHVTAGMSVGPSGRFILSPNSAIDLTNTHMTINYGSGPDPISAIAAYIISGFNNGSWNGPGINSSAAAANNLIPGNSLYGLGYADSADPGNPAGLLPTIEVMYTLLGDANLDGKVNGTDFNILAANFNQSGRSWDEGDFNYDGDVNGTDFVLMADNFNQFASQSATAAADWTALQDFAAANGISLASVPEPASAGIVVIAGMGILRRRRRSSRPPQPPTIET